MSKSITELTVAIMEQLQLEPEDFYLSDGLDSGSDHDSDGDLGLGEQVLLIMQLLAGKE